MNVPFRLKTTFEVALVKSGECLGKRLKYKYIYECVVCAGGLWLIYTATRCFRRTILHPTAS